ncbi:MAG: hypothetical protein EOM24_01560 [Chloroflexia bacterium]|nr:hypothetical protein [Chloroflexia bacterium]
MPIRVPDRSTPAHEQDPAELSADGGSLPEVALPDPKPGSPDLTVPPRLPRPRRDRRDDAPLPPPTAIRGLYRRIGTSFALVGAALIGSLMWYYGGIFSLDYLADTFAPINALMHGNPWWYFWWIPVVISAIELFLWPRRERRFAIFTLRLVIWVLVLAFDVLTTMRGLLPILAELGLPAFEHTDGPPWLAYGISGIIGLAFAYMPEKIARWVLSDLWNLWIAPLWKRFRHSAPQVERASA